MNHPPQLTKTVGVCLHLFQLFFLPCLEYLKPSKYSPCWFTKVTLMTVSNVMSKWFLQSCFFELLTTILECAFCFLAGKVKTLSSKIRFSGKVFFSLSPLESFLSLRKFFQFCDTWNLSVSPLHPFMSGPKFLIYSNIPKVLIHIWVRYLTKSEILH